MRLPGPIKDVYQNITEPDNMLVFAAGIPPVYGEQILYSLDKTFSESSKIDASEKSDFLCNNFRIKVFDIENRSNILKL